MDAYYLPLLSGIDFPPKPLLHNRSWGVCDHPAGPRRRNHGGGNGSVPSSGEARKDAAYKGSPPKGDWKGDQETGKSPHPHAGSNARAPPEMAGQAPTEGTRRFTRQSLKWKYELRRF